MLSELSPNLAMMQVPDIFLTWLVGTIYRLEGLNKRLNKPFGWWRYFTTTTRILFVFPFIFKFCNPSEVWITKALISARKRNPEGFWSYSTVQKKLDNSLRESRTSHQVSSRESSLTGQKTKDSPRTDFSIILQRHTAVTQCGMVTFAQVTVCLKKDQFKL